MKKLFILLALLPMMSLAQTDFRNVNWGMSKEQVQKLETAELIKDSPNLYYKTRVNGLECYLVFYFTNGELSGASYSFLQEHSNKNDFIDDYKSIKSILTDKYGSGLEDIDWKNDLFKNDEQHYGLAISTGDLKYTTHWKDEKVKILLSLEGENYKISLSVDYFVIAYLNTSVKEIKDKAKKDF